MAQSMQLSAVPAPPSTVAAPTLHAAPSMAVAPPPCTRCPPPCTRCPPRWPPTLHTTPSMAVAPHPAHGALHPARGTLLGGGPPPCTQCPPPCMRCPPRWWPPPCTRHPPWRRPPTLHMAPPTAVSTALLGEPSPACHPRFSSHSSCQNASCLLPRPCLKNTRFHCLLGISMTHCHFMLKKTKAPTAQKKYVRK